MNTFIVGAVVSAHLALLFYAVWYVMRYCMIDPNKTPKTQVNLIVLVGVVSIILCFAHLVGVLIWLILFFTQAKP